MMTSVRILSNDDERDHRQALQTRLIASIGHVALTGLMLDALTGSCSVVHVTGVIRTRVPG